MAVRQRLRLLTSWPWLSLSFIAIALINPLGFELVRNTLHGDPLSSAIAGPILMTVLAFFGLLALVEFGVRRKLNKRRLARAAGESAGRPI
jgi:hypothetical protein